MKRRNLLAAVLSFSLVIGMSAPVDLAQESKKTQTAVSIEDSAGETSKYGYLPICHPAERKKQQRQRFRHRLMPERKGC